MTASEVLTPLPRRNPRRLDYFPLLGNVDAALPLSPRLSLINNFRAAKRRTRIQRKRVERARACARGPPLPLAANARVTCDNERERVISWKFWWNPVEQRVNRRRKEEGRCEKEGGRERKRESRQVRITWWQQSREQAGIGRVLILIK